MFGDLVIRYAVRNTSFGVLLLAYKEGETCMVQQGATVEELAAALEARFPSALYKHIRVDKETDKLMCQRLEKVACLLEQALEA